LHRAFWYVLLAPVVLGVPFFALLPKDQAGSDATALPFLLAGGCAIAGGVMLGLRFARSAWRRTFLSVFCIFGLGMVYLVTLMAGCSAILGSPNFR
jgi:hypothetical protein